MAVARANRAEENKAETCAVNSAPLSANDVSAVSARRGHDKFNTLFVATVSLERKHSDVRYRYTFDVQSGSYLQSSMRFEHGGLTFEFVPTGHRFTRLIVETGSVEIQFPPVNAAPGSENLPMLRAASEPLLPAVQREVRALRGALTFWGVLDIDIDQPAVEYLFDTDEEYSSVDALGHALKRKPRGEIPAIMNTPDMLVRCTLARNKFGDYEIPLEFFRRGGDDCYHERYIEAYVNFFFILEYLFGEGEFRTRQLISNFSKSADLIEAIRASQMEVDKLANSQQNHPKIGTKYCKLSNQQTIDEIVRLRGFLQHQSLKRRKTWNPSTQMEFEIDARFLLSVCHALLMKICLGVLFAEDAMKEFTGLPVFEPGNKRIRWVPRSR